jgi:hypothetical protein
LKRLLPTNVAVLSRKRRGLTGLGGQALKFLFGTATSSEVQELQTVISKYENQNEDIVHAVKSQLTLLRTVDKETRQNTADLLNLAQVLRQIVFQVVNTNHTFSKNIDRLKVAVKVQDNISRIMRELEFAALRLQEEFIELHEGIDVSSSGRLSSILILPNNPSALLQQIALKLPRDVSLITSTDKDNMYIYYDVGRVQAYAMIGEIRFCCPNSIKRRRPHYDPKSNHCQRTPL